MNRIRLIVLMISLTAFAAGCEVVKEDNGSKTASTPPAANTNTNTNTAPTPPPAEATATQPARFTLPMLRSFLSDESFKADIKNRLQLSDNQIQALQKAVSESRTPATAQDEESASAYEGRQYAEEKVKAAIGEEKTNQLAALVNDYWYNKPTASSSSPTTPQSASNQNPANSNNSVNAVPSDTRIVVNSPAYRMDVYQNGNLVQSFKVGIGYPEFPLPRGMRQAKEIIFNPEWVPPDEPWVESSNKVKAGEKIEAGSKLNPLGIAKIPIGLPSLIHGGKNPAKIGGFASHGCVGLTDAQLKNFILVLAKISGTNVTEKDIAGYGKNRKETKSVKLATSIPVELRYETLVVEDGKLHIYRDVYDMDTNTEENLRAVLGKYGVKMEDLSDAERTQVMDALKEMSRDAKGRLDDNSANKDEQSTKEKDKNKKATSAKVTRTVKGAKERVIEIAALKGKGYPDMVAMDAESQKASSPAAPSRSGKKK